MKLGRSEEAKAIRKVACNILKIMPRSSQKTGILNWHAAFESLRFSQVLASLLVYFFVLQCQVDLILSHNIHCSKWD